MADSRPFGRTGKAAVGNKGDFVVKAHTGKGGGRGKHFFHARAALWPLIAYNDYIPRGNAAAGNGLKGRLLAVKHAGGAPVFHHGRRDRAAFYHAAVRSKVPPQCGKAAPRRPGVFYGADNCRVKIRRVFNRVRDCAIDRGGRRVNQVLFGKLGKHGGNTPGHVQVFNSRASRRRKAADVRRNGADPVQ